LGNILSTQFLFPFPSTVFCVLSDFPGLRRAVFGSFFFSFSLSAFYIFVFIGSFPEFFMATPHVTFFARFLPFSLVDNPALPWKLPGPTFFYPLFARFCFS